MSQRFRIAVEVKQLRDSVWLLQGRVNVHVTVTASCCEVLVLQFAEGNDLGDWLCMGPRLNRQLVSLNLSEYD